MSHLFPFTALVRREFVATLRKGSSFVFLAILVGGFSWLIGSMWPEGNSSTRAAELSRDLHTTLMLLLWTSCMALVSGMAGTAIRSEKDRSTFESLYLTLIRPSGIVAAKIIGAAGSFLLMVFALMPLAGTLFFLVGVDWRQMGELLVGLVFLSLNCAAVGVFASTVARKTAEAVMGAIVMSYTFYMIGTQLAEMLVPIYRSYSPSRASVTIIGGNLIFYGLAWPIVMGLFFFALTSFLLRRPPKPLKVEMKKPIERGDRAALAARRRRWPFYLIDPLVRKKTFRDGVNPIFLKDLRWGRKDMTTTMVRMFYISLFLFLVGSIPLWVEFGSSAKDLSAMMFAHTMFIMLIAPAVAANSITSEHELGNLAMLRLTPLTPGEIVLGKFMAGVAVTGVMVLASLIIIFPAVILGALFHHAIPHAFPVLITGYLTMALCIALTQAGAILASALARGTGFAAAGSYLIAFILLIGFTSAAGIAQASIPLLPQSDGFAFFFSPLAAYFENMEAHQGGISLYWAANIVMFVPVCAGVLWLAAKVFDRRARKMTEASG